MVSGVDESSMFAATVGDVALGLAQLKADAVFERGEVGEAVLIACDSLFELDGRPLGKPGSAADATDRIRAMRGHAGYLHTGHCMIDGASGRRESAVRATRVTFADMTDAEIDAYVATGEPLEVAGSFTLDGRASVFVESIEGDPSNVIGLSLPLFRELLGRLGISVVDLWR